MGHFPEFMKSHANRIAPSSHHTDGIEGYVFDGSDGSQMAFWICRNDAATAEHVDEFDEYFIVVEGTYFLTLNDKEVSIAAGQECYIQKGTRISGRVTAGTRTIHMFGGRRAKRASDA